MADWKDFFEDGKEVRGQFLDALEQRQNRTQKPRQEPLPVRFCPLCDKPFIEETVLLEHVRSVHGPQHVYLRLNGSVIRDIGWAANGISELIVVPISFTEISVELNAHKFTQSIRVTDNTDLLAYLPSAFEGELTIEVSVGLSAKSRFVVYARSLPEFRHDALDSLIVNLSSEALAAKEMPHVHSWRRLQTLNDLETRYLNGFFEYVLAFHLETSGKRKVAKHHFDESLGLLLPFRTPLAKSAQCVLGLRMNCFGVLRHAPRSSVLALCDKFFNSSSGAETGPRITEDPNPFITVERLNASIMRSYIELAQLSERRLRARRQERIRGLRAFEIIQE